MRKDTGGETWPLTAPEENPDFTPGGSVRFDMNDVPDRSPTGPLAFFIPYLILTLIGTLVPPVDASFATPIPWYDIPRLLVQNVEVRDCWHGTPVSATNTLGEHLRMIEYVGGGYRYIDRWGSDVDGANNVPFELNVAVPLSAGQGNLMSDTSQLALFYQPGSVEVNFKAATVLDSFSTGATWEDLSARMSCKLDARQELILGTGVEWILHRTNASANGTEIQIKGFGRNSKLTGVHAKGGVLALMELSNVAGQGGVFGANNLTDYSFDWRGQRLTRHLSAVLLQLLDQKHPADPNIAVPAGTAPSDYNRWPYDHGASAIYNARSANLLAWFMVLEGHNCRLSDVQTADRDETYHLTAGGGGFTPNEHLILAQYAKCWQDPKRADFVAKVTEGGANSLAAHVLGNGWTKAKLGIRRPLDKHVLTADQETYLPLQFV